jgi:hypothetical protein
MPGVMALPELQQVYGLERQFVINHLGHFLLTNLLLDRVVAAPAGRVVVVSSSALKWADETAIEWDNLSGERDYSPNRFYGQSKLANALFSLELSRRLAGTNATSKLDESWRGADQPAAACAGVGYQARRMDRPGIHEIPGRRCDDPLLPGCSSPGRGRQRVLLH